MSDLKNNWLFELLASDDRRTRVLSDLLAESTAVAKAVRELGAKGKVTLVISVEKDKNDEEALSINYDVTSSIPRAKRKASIAFFDEKAKSIAKTDPRQLELLAEKEDERLAQVERDRLLSEKGIKQIGRGETASA